MRAFMAPLEEINAYKEAVEDIKKQKFPLHISGCIDTQKCHMIYGLSGRGKSMMTTDCLIRV